MTSEATRAAARLALLPLPLLAAAGALARPLVQRLGTLRGKPVGIAQWIDRRYPHQALRELGLERRWPAPDPQGRPRGPASITQVNGRTQ
ncbi:MAG: hypothetical protein QM581_01130 [Pseudomonas sp.]